MVFYTRENQGHRMSFKDIDTKVDFGTGIIAVFGN